MRNQRQLRVGEEIRHVLASLFMRGDIPWPQGGVSLQGVTVTEVQVSPDLKNATVFVMPLGGENLNEVVKALNHIVGHFRHEVAQAIDLRYAPKLRFAADNSFTYAHRIDTILHDPQVAKDLGKDRDEPGEDE